MPGDFGGSRTVYCQCETQGNMTSCNLEIHVGKHLPYIICRSLDGCIFTQRWSRDSNISYINIPKTFCQNHSYIQQIKQNIHHQWLANVHCKNERKPLQYSHGFYQSKSSELPVNIKRYPPGANKSAIILAAAFPSTWYLNWDFGQEWNLWVRLFTVDAVYMCQVKSV